MCALERDNKIKKRRKSKCHLYRYLGWRKSVGKGTFLKGGERRGEKHGSGVFLTAEEWEVKTRRSEKRRRGKGGKSYVGGKKRKKRLEGRGGDRGRPKNLEMRRRHVSHQKGDRLCEAQMYREWQRGMK